MSKRVCIINLSAPEIQVVVLVDNQLKDINLSLPWEIGFRQENKDTLVPCFGEAFERLSSNHPVEVRFPNLDTHFKEITDEKTLECLFTAFLEEIFHRQLPQHGYPIEAMSVYAITPYQWKPIHRRQLRKTFKRLKSDVSVPFLKTSNVTLRSVLSQTLCISVYYQKAWANILADANKCHLFLVDFAQNDFVVYRTNCSQLESSVIIELTDILRFIDFFVDTDEKVSDVQKMLQQVVDEQHVVVGFSGRIDDTALKFIELLQARCSATFLDPQETATLLGGAELVRQFEEKNLEKPLHFVYHFCFGVRLPDGKKVELVPNTWTPPYHRKKAFRVTGDVTEFDVHLYCGLSMTENSDVFHLATLKIVPQENKKYTLNSPMEFILSVTLNDATHGTFALHLPNSQETRSVEFTVPVLMD
ncbi:MAG: hypothetical protein OXH00_18470 [Candidatus Poribacteria bacterium]|nr:hypothetical protein [Candidatus Poribacteria bacterium]